MPKHSFWHYGLIATVVAVMDVGIHFPALALNVLRLGQSGLVYACLFAIFTVLQMFMTPLWTKLADKYGRLPVLQVGLFGSVIACYTMAFANSIEMLFFSRIIGGLFSANLVLCTTSVIDFASPYDRRKFLSRLEGCSNVGIFVIGPLLGGFLFDVSPKYPYIASIALGLLALGFTCLKLDETQTDYLAVLKSAAQNRLSLNGLKQFTSNRFIMFGLKAMLFLGLGIAANDACYQLALKKIFLLKSSQMGILLSFMGIELFICQMFLVGPLLKAFGEVPLLMLGLLFCGLSILAFGLAPEVIPATFQFAIIEVLTFGIGFALIIPAVVNLAAAHSPPAGRAVVQGYLRSAFALGRITAIAHGLIAQQIGFKYSFFVSAFFLGTAFLMAIPVMFYQTEKIQPEAEIKVKLSEVA